MAGARQETRAEPVTADREIVISRVVSVPRALVFDAFTEVRHLSRWWDRRGSPPPLGRESANAAAAQALEQAFEDPDLS
ncbi:hypothetical protein [Kribbella capetownensis]|uniref:hypothetical protein n=1 Tax=Kribbella capetownensis TaxID=1572659 RepID=UPI00192DC2DD|nr:hypothetical protein [Kribbella capetownensis]